MYIKSEVDFQASRLKALNSNFNQHNLLNRIQLGWQIKRLAVHHAVTKVAIMDANDDNHN